MKKFFSLLLTCIMMLSLAACGESAEAKSQSKNIGQVVDNSSRSGRIDKSKKHLSKHYRSVEGVDYFVD